jgi:hypothetical protein
MRYKKKGKNLVLPSGTPSELILSKNMHLLDSLKPI